MVTPVLVVGAAILDGSRLLAAQRAEPPALAGGWELPGGKVEPGETPELALVRECREELGIGIELIERVPGTFTFGPGTTVLIWTARVVDGVPQALEDHLAVRWLDAGEWYDVEWIPADLPAVQAVRRLIGLPDG